MHCITVLGSVYNTSKSVIVAVETKQIQDNQYKTIPYETETVVYGVLIEQRVDLSSVLNAQSNNSCYHQVERLQTNDCIIFQSAALVTYVITLMQVFFYGCIKQTSVNK